MSVSQAWCTNRRVVYLFHVLRKTPFTHVASHKCHEILPPGIHVYIYFLFFFSLSPSVCLSLLLFPCVFHSLFYLSASPHFPLYQALYLLLFHLLASIYFGPKNPLLMIIPKIVCLILSLFCIHVSVSIFNSMFDLLPP